MGAYYGKDSLFLVQFLSNSMYEIDLLSFFLLGHVLIIPLGKLSDSLGYCYCISLFYSVTEWVNTVHKWEAKTG